MSGTAFPDRSVIEAYQRAALRAMLDALVPDNRFYTRKLAAARPGEITSLDDFFARVPFTFKQELVEDQLACPPYGTNLTYPLERYTRFSQTSGTTGTPLRWLDTPESWDWMLEKWLAVYRVCGVGPEDCLFFAFSFGPFLGFWTAFEAGGRLGCLCVPGGGMNSSARLRAILDNGVTVLCCTPTYAMRLAEVAAEEGLNLGESKVRIIFTAGEPGACIPTTRARIEQLWPGARVRDQHGMTEIGPVTYECPARPGTLHVLESGFIPEVLDPDTGRHVGPGEQGELVLTNLGRVGSPLIRYRTGDRVQRAADIPCACGRYDMALEGGILGRTDDMVIVRSVNLYPAAVEEVMRRFDQVAEYRVEVFQERAMTELRIELEPAPHCPDPNTLAEAVAAALRAAFNLRIPVSLAPPGTLPRFELKARRWIRRDEAERRA
jgi:phenylacetate-CoA ligase